MSTSPARLRKASFRRCRPDKVSSPTHQLVEDTRRLFGTVLLHHLIVRT